MPRIATKREKYWGTEPNVQVGDHCRYLGRVARGDKWRKARNKRKAARRTA